MPDQLVEQKPNFNILDIIKSHLIGSGSAGSERRLDDSTAQYRQMYGPSLPPPVSEDIAGFAPKRLTEDYGLGNIPSRPYYVQPGVGVAPSQTKAAGSGYDPDVAAQYEPETKQTKRRK